MSLPGLVLPGLGPIAGTVTQASSGQLSTQPPRRQELPQRSEWRFEVSHQASYTIRLESGTAEIFGVELAPNQPYTFTGYKGAVFTWQGCQLEISGEAESEYVGQETEYAVEWLNVHGMLEQLRDKAGYGPKVLVVGPDSQGKTSLVRSLAAWAVRSGKAPTVINLDARNGLIAPPSTHTAVVVSSQMDVETGFGIGPMSGPTITPLRSPLIYHYPYASPQDKPEVFKSVVTRLALSVMNKIEQDVTTKKSGIIVDSPGYLNDPKSNYDLLAHVISELSIDVILTLGSERLHSDLLRRYPNGSSEEAITLLKVAKPSGVVEADNHFAKALRLLQIRRYFFGSTKESLNPHSHTVLFSEVNIWKATTALTADSSLGPGVDDDDYDVPYAAAKSSSSSAYQLTAPSTAMTGSLVAIKFCAGASDEHTVRDSAIMGFLYVAEVDETRKRIRFLAPHPQRWSDRALVWGAAWPEAIADLVA